MTELMKKIDENSEAIKNLKTQIETLKVVICPFLLSFLRFVHVQYIFCVSNRFCETHCQI
jgi:hypothetical protein